VLNNRTGNNPSHRLKAADKVTGWGLPHPPAVLKAENSSGPALLSQVRVADLEGLRHRDTFFPHSYQLVILHLFKCHVHGGFQHIFLFDNYTDLSQNPY
jgi:hypothetical protein